MDSPGLLDTNIIPGHRDDGDFLYSRANARFHVPAQLFSVDIPMLCRTLSHICHRHPYHETAFSHFGTKTLWRIYCRCSGTGIIGIRRIWCHRRKTAFSIREVTITYKDLPDAFDGYRILQLSDIHSGSWTRNGKAIQKAVDMVNADQADLVVFTGDIVNNIATELDEFIPILSQIKGKDGVYSVLGNHDYSPYIKWNTKAEQQTNLDSLLAKEARMGWQVLNNDHTIIHRGHDSIALVGVENSGNPPFPNYGDLPKALKGTDGIFKVLLSHDPTHWRREVLPESDVQLMLSGHTHEMQFSIFGFSPAKFVYPEHNGLYREGNQALFVNVGL